MKAHFMASVVLLLGWLALLLPAPAQGREIKPRQKWSGRLEKSLESQHPLKKNHLASQGELEATEVLLVATCTCSVITLSPRLDEKGDLGLGVTMTKDLTPDVAYIMALVPRQGILTVEGKPLETAPKKSP